MTVPSRNLSRKKTSKFWLLFRGHSKVLPEQELPYPAPACSSGDTKARKSQHSTATADQDGPSTLSPRQFRRSRWLQSALSNYQVCGPRNTALFAPSEACSDDDILENFVDDLGVDVGTSFRVYFQNINGLKLHDHTQLIETTGFLQNFNVSAVCFAETNVNWAHCDTFETVDRHLRLGFGHSKLYISSSGIFGVLN